MGALQIAVLSICLLVSACLQASKAGQLSADQILGLTQGLPVSFQYTAKDKVFNQALTPEPSHSTHFYYESKEPYDIDERGKWFMRFTLSIYSFDSIDSADAAMANLKEISQRTADLTKCYEYIVQDNINIYWVSAPCRIWDFSQLVDNFHNHTFKDDLGGRPAIRCRSGGFCDSIN